MEREREGASSGERRVSTIVVVLGLAALYFATGRLGLSLAHFQENATLIWPPTGLSLAALILFGRRAWPGVLLGALAVNTSIGTPPGASAAIAVGNTLEALLGWWLLVRVARFDAAFARLRDVLGFLVFGVAACTVVSATFGVAALLANGTVDWASAPMVWIIWWLGDAGGAVVVAPPILVGARGLPKWRTIAHTAETWAVAAALLVASFVAFTGLLEDGWLRLLVAFTAFPFLVWAGLRLGPRGAVLGASVTSIVAVLGTAAGGGPFVSNDISSSLFLLWAYVSTMGAAAMILAAAVAEREAAQLARDRGERARQELEMHVRHVQRLESLGVLAGGIAHDFNNLLAAIRGNAELLRLSVPRGDASATESLDEIELASQRAAELCDQMLSYAGRSQPERRKVELRDVASEMRRLLNASISKRIDVATEFEPAVPAVFADPAQLRQVVMNLMMNAAEAIGPEAGHVELRVGVADFDAAFIRRSRVDPNLAPGRYVYVEVRDDGVGMDDATLERMFDPFYTTKFQGRGLGLATVLGIVSSHGGTIHVDSEPGVGSTFRLLLPPYEADAVVERAPLRRPVEGAQRGLILIADDEEPVRRVVAKMLEQVGWDVMVAADGDEALETFAEYAESLDVVLLDVNMPGKTGPECLALMRGRRPELPAVLMSGFDQNAGADAPGVAFLRKPFRLDGLLHQLELVRPRVPAANSRLVGS